MFYVYILSVSKNVFIMQAGFFKGSVYKIQQTNKYLFVIYIYLYAHANDVTLALAIKR